MTAYDTVMLSIKSMADGMGSWAVLLAAVGAFAMAVLEFFKGLLPIRETFNRAEVEAWIEGKPGGALPWHLASRGAIPPITGEPGIVADQLFDLAIGGKSFAPTLFDQPVEKMLGQVQAAANVALEYPTRYEHLYHFLCHPTGTPSLQPDDAEIWFRFNQRAQGDVPDAAAKEAHQARVRLDNLVRRRLDALQARIAFRWARYNQFLSVSLGAAILWLALQSVPGINLVVAALLAFLGGMIAPLAKDLASALGDIKLRK